MDVFSMDRDLDIVTQLLLRYADLRDVVVEGEGRLLVAVLDRAIKDLREGISAKEVHEWLNRGGGGLFAFGTICEFLGLNPQRARVVISESFAQRYQHGLAA